MFDALTPGSGGDDGGARDQDHGEGDAARAPTGERYQIEPVERIREGGQITKVDATRADTGDREIVAGEYARELIESGHDDPDAPLWLGYNADYHQFREAGLELSQTFRHIWISGVTGAGKTTQLLNMQLQLAYQGHGFLYFDPKGRDSRELLAKIPEHRLDDVIYIDPMSTEYDRTVALNFLELPDHLETDEQQHKEVSRRIEVLKAIMAGDEYWGINMETIMEVVGRGMLLSPADYTVIDLYFILLNQQRRENFAEQIDDPFLADAMSEIAEMDDDDVRPTLKRVMAWVLDPLIRQLISHRESTVDFRQVIDDDQIVIVRTAIDNSQIKRMVTLGIMRSLWSAVQNRAYETDGEPDPYFVFCDEFDDIASEQLDIPAMLARARSMRLSVTLACQHPSQVSEPVLKALKNNAKNLVTFTCEDRDDAEILMERFDEYDAADLLNTDDYTVWTKLPLPGGRSSEPLTLSTFAPYPNLRPIGAVDEIIRDRLAETGVERLTTREIQQQLQFSDDVGILDAVADQGADGEITPDELVDDALEATDRPTASTIAKAIFDAGLQRGVTTGAPDETGEWSVPIDDALVARCARYTGGRVETPSEVNAVVDETAGTLISKTSTDDGRRVSVTSEGRAQIFAAGSSTNAGVATHRELGEESYVQLSRLGLECEVIEQTGARDVDGVARIREILEQYGEGYLDVRPRLARERFDQLRSEHPLVMYLTDGADVTIEYESSTGATKKGQTIRNLAKAYNRGEVCVFAAREQTAEAVWSALTEPPFIRALDGEREVFYNLNKIYIDGEQPVLEGADRVEWSREPDGSIRLADGDGTVRARVDDVAEIYRDRELYDGVASEYDDDQLGRDGPHVTVNEPVVPEREFTDGLPSSSDYRVLVVPAGCVDDGADPTDALRVIDEQGTRPLTDAARDPPWTDDGLDLDHDRDHELDDQDGDQGDDSDEPTGVADLRL